MNLSQKLERIESLTEEWSFSKYNQYKISFLVRMMEDAENHSSTCDECRKNEVRMEQLIEEIPLLDDLVHRQPYEKEFNQIRKHFHQEHGYIPPHYYSSRRAIAIGVLLAGAAAIISTTINNALSVDFVLAGAAVGILIGYLWGAYTELRYRSSKKII
ncbi:hypothetical protein [Roseimarinus sediminis]|uniref:hypothetical protein n=1 Tax=Roseimarinus sediminis TaxID=1610899 RepID=UPI003D2393B1